MKNLRKVTVLVLALLVVFAFSATALAATITVTPPANTGDDNSNTYVIYKVFDAVASDAGVSYKLIQGQTTAPDGFTVDDAGNVYLGILSDSRTGAEGEIAIKVGNVEKYLTPQTTDLTQAQIDAIADYVKDFDPIYTVEVTGMDDAVFENLAVGYYYITTTTGTAVIIKTASDEIEVNDKNTVPELDKKATGEVVIDDAGKEAIAQVGTNVSYEATITIGNGAENYVFHDKMSDGLSYNNDVKVYIGEDEVAVTNYDTTTATGDTLTVAFNNDYIKTLEVGTELVVKYSATITSDALQVNAAKNTATVSYGDENGSNSTPPSEVEVYNAKITVDKKDGNGTPLADAGFVLMNTDGKYYKYTAATETAPATVEWVDNEADATELTTEVVDGVAQVTFTGLGAGTYTLHEKTVPEGYNGAADVTIIVTKASTAANLSQTAEVTNNAGSELPTTGGVGTTIFYILGVVLVAGCGVVLVSRKRMSNK